MAARTGASLGVAVAITVLGILSLGLFVSTLIFFGQAQDANRRANESNDAIQQYVTEPQRSLQAVVKAQAAASEARQTVVEYLLASRGEVMDAVAGNRDMTPEQFMAEYESLEGSDSNSLLGLLDERDTRIATLNRELTAAEEARLAEAERADLEAARVSELASEFDAQGEQLIAAVNAEVDSIAGVREGYARVEDRLQTELQNAVAVAEDDKRSLRTQIAQVQEENLILQDQLRRLRQEGAADRVRPLDEEALVDGTVQAISAGDETVVLSAGRAQKMILGMTFAVYSDATDIRIDPMTGEYPSGKAIVEVIEVEEGFSRARIISESRGNPISRGDVIANAVYDPSKTYKFVVFGNFDIDRNGVASIYERDDVAAMISRWGGVVIDEIVGDLDFVVLGTKPDLPPPPSPTAPFEEVLEYQRLQQIVLRYDELLEQAQQTAIPILNENRLRTLIGDYPN